MRKRILLKNKNKHGMLLASEVLKMVLSVIAIGFLIYLLYSLYYNKVEGEKHDKAAVIMERFKESAVYLRSNESINSVVLNDFIVSGWGVFPYIDIIEKPNACSGENCFCFCDKVLFRQLSKCDDNAVCFVSRDLMKFEGFDLGDSKDPISIEIYEKDGFLGVRKI